MNYSANFSSPFLLFQWTWTMRRFSSMWDIIDRHYIKLSLEKNGIGPWRKLKSVSSSPQLLQIVDFSWKARSWTIRQEKYVCHDANAPETFVAELRGRQSVRDMASSTTMNAINTLPANGFLRQEMLSYANIQDCSFQIYNGPVSMVMHNSPTRWPRLKRRECLKATRLKIKFTFINVDGRW